ncbi:hypothetical protein [Dyadobacter bucti]|uniref:hypothetical protein n=1 Tax=Dyadobacter bucti TaxID=2572203 RepID=UPI00140BAA35|nr:hypothetical protein [Dyadobacter bucti]
MKARMNAIRKFRVWYHTPFGVGIDEKRAISADKLKLSKKQQLNLIEIEHLEECDN